jgi:hypothetical protein
LVAVTVRGNSTALDALPASRRRGGLTPLQTAAFEIPLLKLKPTGEEQDEEDDQDNSDHAHSAVTVAVAIAAKPSAEATQQKHDEDDDEYESNRHESLPIGQAAS